MGIRLVVGRQILALQAQVRLLYPQFYLCGAFVQWPRTLPSQGRDHGFESRTRYNFCTSILLNDSSSSVSWSGPYLFVPLLLGLVAHQSKIIIGIIKNTPNKISCHQPDLLMSCSLWSVNANEGINIARPNNLLSNPILLCTLLVSTIQVPFIISTTVNIRQASTTNHHHYSARVDLLLKSK